MANLKEKNERKIKLIEGQFNAVKKMMSEESDLLKIIQQLEAIRGGLLGLESGIFESLLFDRGWEEREQTLSYLQKILR